MATLAGVASTLTGKVKTLEETLSPKLDSLQDACERLSQAGSKVAESWSGSSLGYHSELHYGDFERPPLQARFNPEWGGIHGLPEGWRARSADEVRERIEQLGGADFSSVEKETECIINETKALHAEIVTELSGLHAAAGLDREKELLGKIERFEWGKTIGDYMEANWSTGFYSRDSRAISEGTRVPAHLYFMAAAYQSETRCAAVRTFIGESRRLLRQVELNAASVDQVEDASGRALKTVLALCDRFHQVARQLRQRRQNRPTLEIVDEYDAQDLLHALLRLHFDDIRPEEWTPSYAGGSARMDFLLKEEQIVVEAKMTRAGLGAKEASEQLIIDAARYSGHPDCKTLVCFVYDPTSLIKNPRGVERDLTRLSRPGLEVFAVVTP